MNTAHFRPKLYRQDNNSRKCNYHCFHPEQILNSSCRIKETCEGCRFLDPDYYLDKGQPIPGDHFLLSLGKETFDEIAEAILLKGERK